MGQLTTLVVGFIIGLVFPRAVVSLKKTKEGEKPLGPQKPSPGDAKVTVSQALIHSPKATPETFDIIQGFSVTWTKADQGIQEFKISFVDGSPFTQAEFGSNGNDSVSSGPASTPPSTYAYYKYTLSIKVGGQWTSLDPGGRVWT